MVYHAHRGDSLRIELDAAEVQHLVPVGTIPGVVVEAVAARCGPGAARLRSSADRARLRFLAPGSASWGLEVAADVDTTWLVADGEDPDKWARVARYGDHLVVGQAEGRVLLADVYANGVGHDDVVAAEALAGDVTGYTLTLKNDSLRRFSHLVAWIDAAVAGLEISDDGLAWVAPTTEATGLDLADVGPGATDTLYLRRTIGVGAASDPDVLNHLHFAYDAL